MSTAIEVLADVPALTEVAARHFAACARDAIAARGAFHVALSGGSTPRPLFERLAGPERERVEWARVHFWWGDERCVPPDDSSSNYRMAREAMLDALGLHDGQVHRIRGESQDRAGEAARYADELLHRMPVDRGVPVFDLMLQGMGADGHTASLFPTTGKALVRDRMVVTVKPPAYVKPLVERISVTAPVIESAREIHALIAGADKAEILAAVLNGPIDLDARPCGLLRQARGTVRWLLDQAAASKLPK